MTSKSKYTMFLLVLIIGLGVSMSGVTAQSLDYSSAPDCSLVDYEESGTESDPYHIENVYELQCAQGDAINYSVESDINASYTESWNSQKGFDPLELQNGGTFDGNEYTIKGLHIYRPTEQNIGLFQSIDVSSVVHNVTIRNATVSGARDQATGVGHVGIVVAESIGGTVENVTVQGNVTGTRFVGGIVGTNREEENLDVKRAGVVKDSYADVNVTGSERLGGAVGDNMGYIENVSTDGTIQMEDDADNNEYNNITGTMAGGIAGRVNKPATANQYANTGIVTESGSAVEIHSNGGLTNTTGGVAGYVPNGTVSKSFSFSTFNNVNESGGVVGVLADDGTVKDSYSVSEFNYDNDSANHNIGGAVGTNRGTIDRVYAVGKVENGSNVGSFVGLQENSTITGYEPVSVTDAYYDTNVSNDSVSAVGSGSSYTGDITGLTKAEMSGSDKFVGFDFINTWTTSSDYPVLIDVNESFQIANMPSNEGGGGLIGGSGSSSGIFIVAIIGLIGVVALTNNTGSNGRKNR